MTTKKKPKKTRKVYQIKATLDEIRPPIWRRLEVLNDTTLEELHLILQVAMGWANYHLHQFTIDGIEYGQPDPDYGSEMEDETKVKLYQVAPEENAKFIYEYDFGDSWQHTVLIEKILPVEKGKHYPMCIKGERACPPEDIGGPWGTLTLSKPFWISLTRNTKIWWSGSGASLTPRHSISKRLTKT